MKFRKRITIIPGVRLNLSGSGVSITGGIPGLSVNVGKRGTYLNTGIPGTGLYERTRLDAPSSRSSGHRGRTPGPARGGSPGTEGSPGSTGRGGPGLAGDASILDFTGDQLVEGLSLEFRVTEDGTVGTFLPGGEEVLDPRILRKVRRSAAFRAEAEALRESFVEDREREMAEILEVHHRTPHPRTVAELEDRRAEEPPAAVAPAEYGVDPPVESDIAAEIAAAARREVGWWPFWSLRRRRREFLQARLPARYAAETARWREEKARFDRDEEARAARETRRLREAYEARITHVGALLAGDPQAIGTELESLLAPVSYPLPFDIDFAVDDDGTVVFDVDMPEIEDLPEETARILSTGKLSVRQKSRRQRDAEYAAAIAALTLFVAGHAFAAAPAVSAARVRGVTRRIDPATGREADYAVVDVTFDRPRFAALRPAAGDPVAMVNGFSPEVPPGEVRGPLD
jgi:hypothetical protein